MFEISDSSAHITFIERQSGNMLYSHYNLRQCFYIHSYVRMYSHVYIIIQYINKNRNRYTYMHTYLYIYRFIEVNSKTFIKRILCFPYVIYLLCRYKMSNYVKTMNNALSMFHTLRIYMILLLIFQIDRVKAYITNILCSTFMKVFIR